MLYTIAEMREYDFGRRSDRSYLCLVTIYVIHALLVNVFLQPQIDVRTSVILSSSHVRKITRQSWDSERNSNGTRMAGNDDAGWEETNVQVTFNSTEFTEQRIIDDDDYSADSPRDAFLRQSQPDGAAIRFLAASKASGVSGLTNNVLDIARRILASLSPAALGILSGCFVFFLTFTENDYV